MNHTNQNTLSMKTNRAMRHEIVMIRDENKGEGKVECIEFIITIPGQ